MTVTSGTAGSRTMQQQYSTSEKLAARARLHQNYTEAEQPWFPWIADRLAPAPGSHILDIGCGPGWFWASVAAQLPDDLDLTLADLSPGMVEEAVARVGAQPGWTVHGREADISALPFADAAFDAVVAMHMLYHVPDPAVGIAEMYRVLKPGGVALVTTNGAGNMREFYALTAAAFGTAPVEPVAALFGVDIAERLLMAQFGDARFERHPARLRVTSPLDVFLALTSFPPADSGSDEQLDLLREAIDAAFAAGNGVMTIKKDTGLVLCRKQG